MLSWPPALIYTALSFVAALGAFQAVALHNRLEGLAWPFGPRHKRLGYLVAGLLLGGALFGEVALVFLDVLVPPPTWAVAFVAGSGLALPVLIAGAGFRLLWRKIGRRSFPLSGSPVEVGPLRATFYRPTEKGKAAVCLLPDPTAPGDDVTTLVQALLEQEIFVLVIDWRSQKHLDRLTLQGLVSVGISHLAQRPEIKGQRVGLVGVGLGGDLALRSMATDSGVAAGLAIEPVLSTRRPELGLEALRDLSWFEARRRARRRRHSPLVEELAGLEAIPRILPRPVGIVVNHAAGLNRAGPFEVIRVEGGGPLVPAAHAEVARRTALWFTKHLT